MIEGKQPFYHMQLDIAEAVEEGWDDLACEDCGKESPIFTSGMHDCGNPICEECRLKWVEDFRDDFEPLPLGGRVQKEWWRVSHLHQAVYFVGCPSEGLVKIGRATDIKSRTSALATSCPVPLVLLGTAARDVWEPNYHQLLKEYRQNGEWFRLDPARLLELPAYFPVVGRYP